MGDSWFFEGIALGVCVGVILTLVMNAIQPQPQITYQCNLNETRADTHQEQTRPVIVAYRYMRNITCDEGVESGYVEYEYREGK